MPVVRAASGGGFAPSMLIIRPAPCIVNIMNDISRLNNEKPCNALYFRGFARVSSSPPCMDKPIKKKAAASIVIFYRSRRPCLALRAIFIFQPCRRFQKGKPPFEFRGFFRVPGLRSAGLHLVKICPPPAPRAGHSSHSSNVNSPFMPVLCHFASRISCRARSVSALSGLRPAAVLLHIRAPIRHRSPPTSPS